MRILIAEDDTISRHILQSTLIRWGYDVIACSDGQQAWQALQQDDALRLAILDWMMPGMDGIQICQKVRERVSDTPVYIILLTSRRDKADIVTGLQAGADDYIIKPFDRQELQARVHVAVRVVQLQRNLSERVKQLEEALAHVKQLQKLLPICSYCKRIRNDQDYWEQAESYISHHSDTRFSHSICPECYARVMEELKWLDDLNPETMPRGVSL
jgi:CheY-like chemotaxis protein